MLDLKLIRDEPERVRRLLAVRGPAGAVELVDQVLAADVERRELVSRVDGLRARRNEVSPQVGHLKKEGRHVEAEPLIAAMRELGEQLAAAESRLGEVDESLRDHLLRIPNLPEEVVPPGGEESNVQVRQWGEARSFDFEPLPHWELGERLGLLDLPRGTKVAGSGFPALVGRGARLERALISLMLDLHTGEHGYTEVAPPYMINEAAATGTGHLPKFGEDMYQVPLDGLWLVPTAEVPLTNFHADELMAAEALPRRYVACTPCFRREAGAHGKDTRGLLRVHQFNKVELVRFEKPADSHAALEELTGHAEAVLRRLGLHYRVVLLAGGDLGFANAQTFDLEVWAPGVGRWLEVSSCSLYTDYQARRAGVRFRPEPNAKPEFVHTLNGSALALPRTLAAVLETGQQADGSIILPEGLAEYMGTHRIAV
ncbi:MAG: serine--tRNA ligase [Gemmatimonadota bacterium]